jgi:cytochrome P450
MPDAHILQQLAHPIPPGPPGYPLVGVLPRLRADPLRSLADIAGHYGDIANLGGRRWGLRWFLISGPEHIQYILQENYRNYRHGLNSAILTKHLAGNGLPVNDGETWLRQRRLIQPAFHHDRIAALIPTVSRSIAGTLDRWKAGPRRGETLDIQQEMEALMLNIVVETMFGNGLSPAEIQAISAAVSTVIGYISWLALLPLPLWLPTARNRAFRQALRLLNTTIYRLIDERRRHREGRDDFLSLLLDARDDTTSTGMTDTQVRDEVMSFFLAGHGPTAIALAWTWYLLAKHPDVEGRVAAEADAVLGDRAPTLADVARLTYTRMVVEEAMRLYPPAWLFTRSPRTDDVIGGYTIPRGSVLLISPYVTHRRSQDWEHPETFDPLRFTPEHATTRSRFAYIPFGGGPHLCIGNHLAVAEAQLIVAAISRQYQLRLAPGHDVEPEALLLLRARHGMPMLLRQRNRPTGGDV